MTGSCPDGVAIPPWEQRTLGQVPFTSMKSPRIHPYEDAIPSFWSTNPPLYRNGHDACQTPYRKDSGSLRDAIITFNQHQIASGHSPAGLSPYPPPAPYETQVDIPRGPKSAPTGLPSFVEPHSPPPKTFGAVRSTRSSSLPMKLPDRAQSAPTIEPLPGTMAARRRDTSLPRDRSRSQSTLTKRGASPSKVKQNPLRRHFRSAVKDIFKREPIDNSAYEHIRSNHWADE